MARRLKDDRLSNVNNRINWVHGDFKGQDELAWKTTMGEAKKSLSTIVDTLTAETVELKKFNKGAQIDLQTAISEVQKYKNSVDRELQNASEAMLEKVKVKVKVNYKAQGHQKRVMGLKVQ
ncbi:hypothetical protein R1sor_001100 [Riccia sorocarpa]|uniref:Uncharacterized protein n=1 Tax=Riccia sorocarpa TaxID=122646 RepID=A0ABD3GVW5_9MARC